MDAARKEAAMASRDELSMSNEEVQSAVQNITANSDDDNLDAETAEESQEDDDLEIPSWEDEEGDQADTDADEEASAPAKKQAQKLRDVKANGKVIQVNMADQARVDQLLSLGLGARQVFTERDQLKKQAATLTKENQENRRYRDLWMKLEASKSDHDGLYEKIFGKPFEQSVGERSKQRAEYEAASPEERRLMDLTKKAEAAQKAIEDAESRRAEREKELDERTTTAERAELKSMLTPHFHKYEFSSKVSDPVKAEKLNAVLWKTVINNLRGLGDDVEVTQATIAKEFRETAELLAGAAKQEVKRLTDEKKKTSKQRAQVASTRNYNNDDLAKFAKDSGDPVKLFRNMFKKR